MNVLLAVDQSESSLCAIQSVFKRTLPGGSAVRVLCVVEKAGTLPVGVLAGAGGDPHQDQQRRIAEHREFARGVADSLAKAGFSAGAEVREGKPADVIVRESREWPADLIVIGSHGFTGLERFLLGNVAESVVLHAPCSVEVVRGFSAVPKI